MEQTDKVHARPLAENGHDSVPIKRALAERLQKLAALWVAFVAQPLALKSWHVFKNGSGFEHKTPEQGDRDFKDDYHVKLGTEVPENATDLDREFLAFAKKTIHYVVPVVRLVTQRILQQTGCDLWPMIAESMDQWVLRFLWYPPRDMDLEQSNVVAAEHVDKGLTIHFYESDEGLEIRWNGKWYRVPPEALKATFYGGLLAQLHTLCKMIAVMHRGVFTRKTMRTGRYAIVLFIDFGKLKYDKARWKSTHDAFPDDSNYEMPIEEFSQFFTQLELATD